MMKNRKKSKIYLGLVIVLCLVTTTPIITGLYLDDLEDVTISSLFDEQLLQYNDTSFNWTNVNYTADGDGYAGAKGHPHDQDLNTTSDVVFNDIISNGNLTVENDIFFDTSVGVLYLGEEQEAIIGYDGSNLILGQMGRPDITSDVNGIIGFRLQSSCRVRLGANQNIPRITWTKLLLTVEDYDRNNDFDTFLVRFVCPANGLYQVNLNAMIELLADQDVLRIMLYKNGVMASCFNMVHSSCPTVRDVIATASDCLYLTVNDFLEFYVFHDYSLGIRTFPAFPYTNYMTITKVA